MDTILNFFSKTIVFIWDLFVTCLGYIWGWIVAFFGFLSTVPISDSPFINATVSFIIVMVVLAIIGKIVGTIQEKTEDAKLQAELEAAEKAAWELANTCPHCHEIGFLVLDKTEELERYKGTREVRERSTRGVKTRHVSCTKIVEKDYYHCKKCGETCSSTKTRELA
ncbi:hypothetical protein [Lonepinella sp. BR2919]|uniref:hypothetical protein n=1 Tax=unclassified Lonepinella TaxID=2642006 RepID=UPI003F6E3F44